MKTLVIERRRWLRGGKAAGESLPDGTYSSLYESTTKTMCCLGFLARSRGAKVVDIADMPTPKSSNTDCWPKKFFRDGSLDPDSTLVNYLMDTNDTPALTNKKREALLKAKFAEFGYKLIFK